MVCPQCGKRLEEPKAFCKYCGARLPSLPAPPLPGEVESQPVAPPVPPSAERASEAPVTRPTGYAPPPPPPVQAPPQTQTWPPAEPEAPGRARWLLPVLLAVAVLAVGALTTASILVISQVTGDKPLATDPVPTGDGPATTDAPAGSGSAYIEALDHLDALLIQADNRIVESGAEIDETAPDVSDSVDDELADLQLQVDDALGALAAEEPPQEYLPADGAIFSAGDEMLVCLDQTRQGILAMWLSGQIETGAPYFERAAEAQDRFHALFDRYRQLRP